MKKIRARAWFISMNASVEKFILAKRAEQLEPEKRNTEGRLEILMKIIRAFPNTFWRQGMRSHGKT